jgi:hypothetical protein
VFATDYPRVSNIGRSGAHVFYKKRPIGDSGLVFRLISFHFTPAAVKPHTMPHSSYLLGKVDVITRCISLALYSRRLHSEALEAAQIHGHELDI